MILVSSCLAGMKVRYNGTDSLDVHIQKLVEEKKAVTICPELLGGFVTRESLLRLLEGQARMC